MKKWQIAVSILLVFALGTAAGAFGSRIIFKKRVDRVLHSEGTPGIKVLQGMVGRLDLSEPQRASINAILDENNKKWETIREEYEPQIKALFETVLEETKKELTAEQREEIEQMSAKIQRRLPPRTTTHPGSSSPPRAASPPEASAPPEESTPPDASQPFGRKFTSDRVAGIMKQLQIDKEISATVRPIIESDIQGQEALRDAFETSQAAAEEKYRKAAAEAQMATEKNLLEYLTPDQMETYRQLLNAPEEPPADDFGFDGYGDGMDHKAFQQESFPNTPAGNPGKNQQGTTWSL